MDCNPKVKGDRGAHSSRFDVWVAPAAGIVWNRSPGRNQRLCRFCGSVLWSFRRLLMHPDHKINSLAACQSCQENSMSELESNSAAGASESGRSQPAAKATAKRKATASRPGKGSNAKDKSKKKSLAESRRHQMLLWMLWRNAWNGWLKPSRLTTSLSRLQRRGSAKARCLM